jgi:hypothetical protein
MVVRLRSIDGLAHGGLPQPARNQRTTWKVALETMYQWRDHREMLLPAFPSFPPFLSFVPDNRRTLLPR